MHLIQFGYPAQVVVHFRLRFRLHFRRRGQSRRRRQDQASVAEPGGYGAVLLRHHGRLR